MSLAANTACWMPVSMLTVRAVFASAPMTTFAKPYPNKEPTGHMSAMTAADGRDRRPVRKSASESGPRRWRGEAPLDFYTVAGRHSEQRQDDRATIAPIFASPSPSPRPPRPAQPPPQNSQSRCYDQCDDDREVIHLRRVVIN